MRRPVKLKRPENWAIKFMYPISGTIAFQLVEGRDFDGAIEAAKDLMAEDCKILEIALYNVSSSS